MYFYTYFELLRRKILWPTLLLLVFNEKCRILNISINLVDPKARTVEGFSVVRTTSVTIIIGVTLLVFDHRTALVRPRRCCWTEVVKSKHYWWEWEGFLVMCTYSSSPSQPVVRDRLVLYYTFKPCFCKLVLSNLSIF